VREKKPDSTTEFDFFGKKHHDISTTTGEEVVLFTLAESPLFRDVKRKIGPLKPVS